MRGGGAASSARAYSETQPLAVIAPGYTVRFLLPGLCAPLLITGGEEGVPPAPHPQHDCGEQSLGENEKVLLWRFMW